MDSTLFNAIEAIKQQQQQLQSCVAATIDNTDDNMNELLVVATSYLLPRLVSSNFYHVEYESLDHSAHCTAYAIKELMVCIACVVAGPFDQLSFLSLPRFSTSSSSDTAKSDWTAS